MIFSLTDYQKTIVEDTAGPQIAESIAQEEAAAVISETRVSPRSHLFASSAERYRQENTAVHPLESASGVEDDTENPIPEPQCGELKIED